MPKQRKDPPSSGGLAPDKFRAMIVDGMQQALHAVLAESGAVRQVTYRTGGLADWTQDELASVRELKAALARGDSPAFDDDRSAAYWLALQFKIMEYESRGLPVEGQ